MSVFNSELVLNFYQGHFFTEMVQVLILKLYKKWNINMIAGYCWKLKDTYKRPKIQKEKQELGEFKNV